MPYDPTLEDKAAWFYQIPDGVDPPPIGDGKTYSNMLGWQSPEGNFYGQERWVRDWYSSVVWNGEDYQLVEEDGAANSISELPMPGQINPRTGLPYGPRLDFEMWTVPRENWPPTDLSVYDGRSKEYYWWDTTNQEWNLVEWYYTITDEKDLPRPGIKKGAAHLLIYSNIKVMWDGYTWRRYSLDMIDGGERVDELESLTELTSGQVQTLQTDHNEYIESYLGYR